MATIRSSITVDRSVDDVWKLIADAGTINEWFPLVEESAMLDDNHRTVTLRGGIRLTEEIITNDADLRRFQYRIIDGDLPIEHHIGTIDVIEVEGKSLVVYSTDVEPAELAEMVSGAIEGAVTGLAKKLC
ncbi:MULTISPECIES: SRPBCC family protein [Rhodococcus]|uniref:SRPBCC family protein n=1 Tax=Rhodococcus qingshengii JCM 15477 TaxID=1303681 RepID=A0AB38R676_RHOSG|nr:MULTISPECIES: SRPBCC family protein [Rhodococcus]MCD2131405.1 SRPBCC family protein [Rhodococcus qingshengii]UPU40823.1 SRPBCC family protein [Rhodococcus qingshengii JCM 15477]